MANSRYDNIKYFDGSSFKIPGQIKVYNGSAWVDLGAKDSYNTKKLCVRNTNNFICATYYRHDVNIPKTVEVGGGSKYIRVYKDNSKNARFDNWLNGFVWEMVVEVYQSSTLYCAYAKNQGDITNQAYFNVYADVKDGKVRVRTRTRFHGYTVSDRKFVDAGPTGNYEASTGYNWNVGDKVTIKIVNKAQNGAFYVTVTKADGTVVVNDKKLSNYVATFQVETPNVNDIGSCIKSDDGTTEHKGKALIHRFKYKPNRSGDYWDVNFNNASNNATSVNSSGGYSGRAAIQSSKVHGESYTEYIRQTI